MVGREQEWKQEAIATVQVRDDGVLDCGGGSQDEQKFKRYLENECL